MLPLAITTSLFFQPVPLPEDWAAALQPPFLAATAEGLRYQLDSSDPMVNEPLRPEEFLSRGAGDCEDFVILRYAAARAGGEPAEALFVVIVDVGLPVYHAVLGRWNGTSFTFEETIPGIQPYTSITPLYILNENGAWQVVEGWY